SGTGGITGPASSPFTVNAAAADHLGFFQQPTDVKAGVAVSPAVTVQVYDRFGNFASNDNTDHVTLSVATRPRGFAAASTTTASVANRAPTFPELSFDTPRAAPPVLSGTGGIPGPASAFFTVTPAAAASLAFFQQPTTTTAGVAISPAVTVRLFDRFGNLAT